MQENFGKKGKDIITGFEGTIIGFCTYMTGCNQLLLAPKYKDGVFRGSLWFDVDRVVISGKAISIKPKTANGADEPAPNK